MKENVSPMSILIHYITKRNNGQWGLTVVVRLCSKLPLSARLVIFPRYIELREFKTLDFPAPICPIRRMFAADTFSFTGL